MTSVKKSRWGVTDEAVFDVLLLLFFVVMSVASFQYNARAQSIPLAVGVVGALMMAVQLMVDTLPRVRARLGFVSQGGLLSNPNALSRRSEAEAAALDSCDAPPPAESAKEESTSWVRVFRMVLWLFGFAMLLAWTHYLIAVGVFTFFVVVGEAKESWVRALVLTLCVCASYYVLFNIVLGAQL